MTDIFKYTIDKENRITSVSENWTQFAMDNKACPSCVPPDVIGKPLFDFITGNETAYIYQLLIEAVRKSKPEVNVTINCDSPDTKRFLNIRLRRLEDDAIEFESHILGIQQREFCDILNCDAERSEEQLRICSFCKAIEVEGKWLETEHAVEALKLFDKEKMPTLSHGICKACYKEAMAQLDEMK